MHVKRRFVFRDFVLEPNQLEGSRRMQSLVGLEHIFGVRADEARSKDISNKLAVWITSVAFLVAILRDLDSNAVLLLDWGDFQLNLRVC